MSLAPPDPAPNGRVSFDGRPESRVSQHGSGVRFGPDEGAHDVQERVSGSHTPQPPNTITLDYPSDVKGTMSAIKIENTVPIGRPGAYLGDLLSCKWDDEGGSPVAVRRLRFRVLSPSQKKDLEDIARLWRELDTDYIVEFHGLGKDGSQLHYFVSRWVPDRSLWDFIQDNKDCDRGKYLKSAAVALRYLHTRPTPIAHGNFKAQNILISGGRALLCDMVPPKLSVFSMTGRSQATHRSPEGGISLPSDVYAFGLTVYEAEEEWDPSIQQQTLKIRQTADALKYLHEQKIIHGDIKGSNILLSNSTHALLCDFGMSRMVGEATKSQLKGGGSYRWMPPEISDGKPKSFQSDVFSFGLTIYQLLSDRLPLYELSDGVIAAVALIRGQRPPREPESSPTGDSYESFWDIAESCWQKTPEARPSIAQIFKDISSLTASFTPSDTVESPGETTTLKEPSHAVPTPVGTDPTRRLSRKANSPQGPQPNSGNQSTILPFSGFTSIRLLAVEELDGRFKRISLESEQPLDVSGSLCDLFRGTGDDRQLYALKRYRFPLQGSSFEDQLVRRFTPPVSENTKHVNGMDIKTRVVSEATGWRELQHEFLLPFIGTARDEVGFIYFIYPWEEHRSLPEYLKQYPDTDARPRLIHETAQALEYLHELDIIHGDVKAGNVLVGRNVQALLCDYGLVGLLTAEGSQSLNGGENFRRDSPELWEGHPRSTKSDVYAFGMTIYEILSGRIPFYQYRTTPALTRAVKDRGELPPQEPEGSPSGQSYAQLWRIAERCWIRDPEERPSMPVVVPLFDDKQVSVIMGATLSEEPLSLLPSPSPSDVYTQSSTITIAVLRSPKHATPKVREPKAEVEKRVSKQMRLWKSMQDDAAIIAYLGYAILENTNDLCLLSPRYVNADIKSHLKLNPEANRMSLISQISNALNFLHSQDPAVVHGDLVEVNIIVDVGGRVKIRNFGLWTLLGENSASVRRVFKPSLLAPKLSEGQNPSKETDVYAFACLALVTV
ncbi:hypothetical protein FRB99_003341 [Tulasnella sp. 403]|nr:hypothetical protein FRB99_003341 [Tulasnella sp. 403]